MCEVEANLRIEQVFTSLPIVSYLIGNNNESYVYKTKMDMSTDLKMALNIEHYIKNNVEYRTQY